MIILGKQNWRKSILTAGDENKHFSLPLLHRLEDRQRRDGLAMLVAV